MAKSTEYLFKISGVLTRALKYIKKRKQVEFIGWNIWLGTVF